MQTIHATQPGVPAWIMEYAISAPIAPTAPKARYSTPVARYRTTSPTPDRAYTPPRARPLTMKGSKFSQGGITSAAPGSCWCVGRGAGRGPVLRDLRVDRGDRRTALGRGHLAVLRRDRVVAVVRDVQR